MTVAELALAVLAPSRFNTEFDATRQQWPLEPNAWSLVQARLPLNCHVD
jgi:hypothetical protein